jgi:HEAT repeat protein
MATINVLRSLSDGKFHRLGDDLLRRLEPRYRRLRTHGLNEKGESIKGQPDSYVGDTANTCTIAVCYTVQRADWWNKVVKDVKEAVEVSPSVDEVVAVIPHNADRDGPKRSESDWHSRAKAAAGRADFRLIDGRDISVGLDTDHQDLRHRHLGIPYSRLSSTSILASARQASEFVLETIRQSGRYDPARYSQRFADREIYRLWQRCLQWDDSGDRRIAPVRMIALVNDSGLGKTSLVCSFADSLGAVLPVVLIQARDLAFGAEDSLVAYVVHALQGVLEPSVRAEEEVALTRHFAGQVPLTVVVDGLDEAHSPDAVRRAITFWLRSRIGQSSALIVTSRPEFWKMCSDQSWKRWMPGPKLDDRVPVTVAGRNEAERLESDAAVRLPDRFTEAELEDAWVRAGRERVAFYVLPADSREELRHPFSLRVYLDLCAEADIPSLVIARADLMDRWLNRRLDAEAVSAERITRDQFQCALRIVARMIVATGGGSVPVDNLADVPRFDRTHPPGPVVQRLIAANILESVPGRPDCLRFTVEAVQDHYRAEADIEDIQSDPTGVAQQLSQLRFTEAYSRLARIGRRLGDDGVGHRFVGRLVELDPRMAAVLIATDSSPYTSELRSQVATALGQQIYSRYRVQGAFAITTLGDLDCPEAAEVLAKHLLPPSDSHQYLKHVGATAFARLGYLPAADFVHRWERFGPASDPYYFKDLLALYRRTKPEFRKALATRAARELGLPSGTREHAKAVCVLAHLGDEQLIEHLRERIANNGVLDDYENHALVALGTDAAGSLFEESVRAVADRLAAIPNDHVHHNDRYRIKRPVLFRSYDVRYLLTSEFEPHLRQLIDNPNKDISWIGSDLVRSGVVASLFYPAAVLTANWEGFPPRQVTEQRSRITADDWLTWWRTHVDVESRKRLLRLLLLCPTGEVEEVLISCLEASELRALAAQELGDYGAVRAAPRLREILAEDGGNELLWDKAAAAEALGYLRDSTAVPLLKTLAAEYADTDAAFFAVASLGFIGTSEAKTALCELLDSSANEDEVVQALIACGTPLAVATAIARAKTKPQGAQWLSERVEHLGWTRGWRLGEYYTHIATAELVNYLETACQADSPGPNWETVFRQIDSADVCRLLPQLAAERAIPADSSASKDGRRRMSERCFRALMERGDDSAISYVLDDRAEEKDDVYVWICASHLRHFPSNAVANELRRRLSAANDNSQMIRLLALLGRFGDASDAERIRPFLDHADDLVANVACENLLRLTDPLLVPDGWREI